MKKSKNISASFETSDLIAIGERLQKKTIGTNNPASAESLISIEDGVRMFNITLEGAVSTPSDSTQLHIIKFKNELQTSTSNSNEPQTSESSEEEPPVFLHVGDWIYPLIPGVSPVLHSQRAAYIFPDFMTSQTGSFVGFIFPDSLPHEVTQRFEDIIRSFGVLLEQVLEHQSSEQKFMETIRIQSLAAVDMIPKEVIEAAKLVAHSVEREAEKVERVFQSESRKFMQSKMYEMYKTDPNIQKGVTYAREVSDTAVKVSGDVVNKLGDVTVALGKALGPPIKHGKDVLLQSLEHEIDQSTSNVDERFHRVYSSLDAAAKILDIYLAKEGVRVRHNSTV